MKTKLILIAVLATTLGGAAGWLAPHHVASSRAAAGDRKILYYTCPMHPSVKSDKPGACPICGMNLVPVYDTKGGTSTPSATVSTNRLAAALPSCCSMAGGGCQ